MASNKNMTLKERLIQALNQSNGERKIHDFLKKEPLLVWATFMDCGGHSDYVIPEFSFGTNYRADFAVMQSFSGGWNVAFVELEPVGSKPFYFRNKKPPKNTNQLPKKIIKKSARFSGALDQVKDWRKFERCNGTTLRENLANACKRYDTLFPERNLAREAWCAKLPLRDSQTYLNFKYFIVMGRRSHFDEDLIQEKAQLPLEHSEIKLLTYDRFIEVADKLEQQNENYKNRKIETEDQEFLSAFNQDSQRFLSSGSHLISQNLSEIDVCGTSYKIQSIEDADGFSVVILGTCYEIFEDRKKFSVSRIEPDGLGLPLVDHLESPSAAIQFAEIYERLLCFHTNTSHSLDLVDDCLQLLRGNLSS